MADLPPWRRLLATFNWRPVYDIEQELFASSSQAPSTGDSSPT